ncbi:NAD(P)-dependent oxidoreductase [Chloroflexota bacterium]
MREEKIGFVGLGEMGKPMAENLVRKGFNLTVYDIRTERVEELKALGATVARSLKDLAEVSNKIIIMVRDVPQTEEVIFGKRGMWGALTEGATIITTNSINPLFCRELEARAREKKIGVLDAPVSGSRTGAAAGTLAIMVGGEEHLFKECLPIFEAMGSQIYHMGDIGAGEIAKLANGVMFYISVAAAFEGLALASHGGLKLDRFREVVRKSTGNSWAIENWDLLVQRGEDYRREGKKGVTFMGMPAVMDSCLSLARHLDVHLPVLALVVNLDIENELLREIKEGWFSPT